MRVINDTPPIYDNHQASISNSHKNVFNISQDAITIGIILSTYKKPYKEPYFLSFPPQLYLGPCFTPAFVTIGGLDFPLFLEVDFAMIRYLKFLFFNLIFYNLLVKYI